MTTAGTTPSDELLKQIEDLQREVQRLLRTARRSSTAYTATAAASTGWRRQVLASAYHADADDHHGAFRGRPHEFVDWAVDLLSDEWDISLHLLDVNNVEIEGDTAHSECYVLFSQRRRDGGGTRLRRRPLPRSPRAPRRRSGASPPGS